jgi:hypothetical protein
VCVGGGWEVGDMVELNYGHFINTMKHNIITEEAPKMDSIGDYWNKDTVTQFIDLLKQYKDISLSSFSKMKGIARSLGVVKIQLNPNAKSVKMRPLPTKSKI